MPVGCDKIVEEPGLSLNGEKCINDNGQLEYFSVHLVSIEIGAKLVLFQWEKM